MFKIAIDSREIREYNDKLKNILIKQLPEISANSIGYQGGFRKEEVYYSSEIGFWYTTSEKLEKQNKIWNAFGNQDPFKSKGLDIAVEINFPFELDRQISGVFMENEEKNIYIGHRGNINRVKKNIIMNEFDRCIYEVDDGGQTNNIIMISALEDSNLVDNIKKFVDKIIYLKKKYR